MNEDIVIEENNDYINIQEDPENKELTFKPSIYKKLNDKYYSIIDKLHLRFLTNIIDKIMSSMIFFIILIIVACVCAVFCFSGSSLNEYKLTVFSDNVQLKNYTLFLNSGSQLIFENNGKKISDTVVFQTENNADVVAKIIVDGYSPIIKKFSCNETEIKLNIKLEKEIEELQAKENLFSFVFVSKTGTISKFGKINVKCDDFSQDYQLPNGYLNNEKLPCNAVSVSANIENYPSVNQTCNPGLCRIVFNDVLSDVKTQNVLPKNKLVVYVNNKYNEPQKDITVDIREDSITKDLIDSGKTKDFGSYSVDLIAGKYIVSISDSSGKYAGQMKNITVGAGNLSPVIFVLEDPAIGKLNVGFSVEDYNADEPNFVQGTIFLKDVNQNILETKRFD